MTTPVTAPRAATASRLTTATRRVASAGLAALAFAALTACGTTETTTSASIEPVTITALSGASVTVPGDKPTAMFYFSVGCGACVGGAKALGEAAEKTGGSADFVLVDIDPGESAQIVSGFQDYTETTDVPAVIDTDASLSRRFQVAAQSTLIVVDPAGAVTYRAQDPSTDQIIAELAKAATK